MNDMITILIYLVAGAISLLIALLPTWDIIPSTFVSLFATAVAWCWGLDWLLPMNDLFTALKLSFAIDLVILSWVCLRWIIGWIPFIKHH